MGHRLVPCSVFRAYGRWVILAFLAFCSALICLVFDGNGMGMIMRMDRGGWGWIWDGYGMDMGWIAR